MASLAAIVIRALTLLLIIKVAGPQAVGHSFAHLHPMWIWVVAAAELLTYPAYLLAYHSVAQLGQYGPLSKLTMAWIVVAGFGPVALSGGFGVDKSALLAIEGDEASAQVRVGAMASMEWAVLAPVAWLVAVLLVVTGTSVSGSLLWPWIIGTPAAMAFALWAIEPGRMDRLSRVGGRRIAPLAHALEGIKAVRVMAEQPRRYAWAWGGTAMYWAAEICALYGALRTAGLNLGVEMSVLAYVTGYLASRRSLPLGGAGLTEALLVYSLYELHEPLGPAVIAVLTYRAFNFLVVVIPALLAYRQLIQPATSEH
jgi:uncharacterized membrane protein YbhN (UPF0104 family)